VAWGHVMGSWSSPSTYPTINGALNSLAGRIYTFIFSCPSVISMSKLVVFAMSLCAQVAELSPVDGHTGRCSHLVHSPHPWSFSFLSRCNSLAMPRYRPRGKPKRGSSWKPRRPLLTSSDSSASDASPPRLAEPSPVPLRPPQPRSMAVIQHTPTSIMRLSHNPTELPSSSMHPGEPPEKWSEPPPPQPAPRRAGPCYPEYMDRIQFAESLGTLHDLAFELRREVADLQYRFQVTEAKVVSFMQIVSSMHEALFAAPEDTCHTEHAEATPLSTQPSEAAGAQQRESRPGSEDVASTREAAEPWDYGVTVIEEEPGSGDAIATWPTYKPTI
jgi:hypothetical protein